VTRGRSRAGRPSPHSPSKDGRSSERPFGRGVGGEGARTGHLPRIRRNPSSGASRHLLPKGEGEAAPTSETVEDIDSETTHHGRARGPRRILVIACGALAREVLALKLDAIDVACLPAQLHNHPKRIPEAMRAKIRANREAYDEILCLYGDCGTGGELDRVLAEEGVRRIAGAHCYAFYAGEEAFAALAEEEPGTFYLTDFLVRHFDALVIRGLGLDRFPELRDDYFGNYRRVVHLAQFDDPDMETKARGAAERLGLAYERRFTGLEGIRSFLDGATRPIVAARGDAVTDRVYSGSTELHSAQDPATQKKDASWPT
jgi:Protein of unknown function (DUF1638)